ncbi:hypothetical protein SAY87_025572 [Trapa incisa]|uniref:Uncharacterized protein n=1 Tax=Trapa incisa TaxID=236973 RepID=A0AAN7JFW0_9MYRT|nr:hypothetical protein SAY87_025572 [Trapa incisa]
MAEEGGKRSAAAKTRSAKRKRRNTEVNKWNPENQKKKQEKVPSTPPRPSSLSDSTSTTVSSSPEKHQRLEDQGFNLEEPTRGTGGFSTPKSLKYRIPEIGTCPPAPKRQRSADCSQNDSRNRSLSRRRIVFSTRVDLEVFFLLADNTITS